MPPSSRNLLPLAAGLLHSYARSIPEIQNNLNLNIEFLRDSPEKVITKYENPALLSFSTYFWNFNQSIQVARLAKKKFPNVPIIFGGPMAPLTEDETKDFFERYPFVDITVSGEGEIVFSDILLALITGGDIGTVPGICYRDSKNKILVFNKRRPYITDLSVLPSPYLDGTFDDLFEKYPNAFTGAIFETNRGCPFSCTYCYWGGPDSRVSVFSLERICAELDWISKHKIKYISGADANFGILIRDIEIAKYIAKLNKETTYPEYLAINWTKNSSEKIFDMAEVLSSSSVKFMITASLQSHNPDTLKAVKRSNINYAVLSELIGEARGKNYDIYSEIILGLPLETYQSFVNGIREILVNSLNYYFNLYYCYLIPSTQMARPDYIEKYQIETRRCIVSFERTEDMENAVSEYEDIVVSTSTMSIEEWKKSFTFGYFIKALYGYRTAYFIFNYLRKEYDVDLIELTEFIINECLKKQFYKIISHSLNILDELENSILNNDHEIVKLEGVKTSMHPEVAVLITFLSEKELFYQELYHCLNKYFFSKKININYEVYDEVFTYQFLIIPTWKQTNKSYIKFNHNIYDFFDLKKNINRTVNKLIIGDGKAFEWTAVDDFIAKQIYGGLKFSISTIKKQNDNSCSSKYIDAKDYFDTFKRWRENI